MAFDFPSAPTLGQTYTPTGGPTYVWNGTAWVVLSPGSSYSTTIFTATASQTTFSTTYVVGSIYVYRNGVLLAPADYIATNGTSIVLANACNAGDTIEVINLAQVPYVNCVQKTGDTMTGTLNLPSNGLVVGTTQLVASGGCVGIGTASVTAGYRLEVAGGGVRNSGTLPFYDLYTTGQAANDKWWRVTGANGGGSAFAVVAINDAGTNAESPYQITRSGHLAQAHIWSTNGVERMRVDSTGQVGIGTSSPGGILHVSGANDSLMLVSNTTASIRFRPYITSVGLSQVSAVNAAGNAYTPLSVGGSYTVFETGGAERSRIDQNGQMFLGTTTSGIAGAYNTKFLVIGNDATTSNRLILGCGSSTSGYDVTIYPNDGGVNFLNNSGSRDYYFYKSSGAAYATVTAVINNVSDYRLKENVVDMNGALAKLARVRPVHYNFKSDIETKMPWGEATVDGFIAHELQAVMPEAVYGEKDAMMPNGEKIKPQQIDMTRLIPALVGAVQELSAKLDEANARIAKLEGAA